MIFHNTPIPGAAVIDLQTRGDERGFFARAFCAREFAELGLVDGFVQANDSLSEEVGTLRGLHYQLPPFEEVKVVRCIRGALYDVIVDLRTDSPAYRRWFGVELTANNRRALYVPKGCAHGFITLEPTTEAFYLVSAFYSQENERGVRWDDPAFGIAWPLQPTVVSPRDRSHPDFSGKV